MTDTGGGSTSSDERTWAILVHVSAFAGMVIPFGNIFAPFVVWLIKKPDSVVVDHHGREALNFQISMTIYLFPILLLMFVIIGFFLLPLWGIFWIVMVIVATVRAADGANPGYVLSIPFLR